MFPYDKLSESAIARRMDDATPAAVDAALARRPAALDDIIILLSPAAGGRLDAMRRRAAAERLAHFGRTASLYAPIYVSSACVNACAYCAFQAGHGGARRRLSVAEALEEAKAVRSTGVDSILVVSGEDPAHVDVPYLSTLVARLRGLFSHVAIEVQPMRRDDYRRIVDAGASGLALYQETYSPALYARLHTAGPKRDFEARLQAVEEAAAAGFASVAIGALLGLRDWRVEGVCLAAHAAYLRKTCWRTRVQLAFPRVRPIPGGFAPAHPVPDSGLEQMLLAFRIVFPDCDIALSTREAAPFRDRMIETCVNRLSAGSRVAPGAYAVAAAADDALGQFHIHDNRSVADVAAAIARAGLEAVFKDWDPSLSGQDARGPDPLPAA